MKLDKVANSGNDEFYTPPYAIEPILKYVKPNSRMGKSLILILKGRDWLTPEA